MPADEKEKGKEKIGRVNLVDDEDAAAQAKPKIQAPFTRVGLLLLLVVVVVEAVMMFVFLGGLKVIKGREGEKSNAVDDSPFLWPDVPVEGFTITKPVGIAQDKTLQMTFHIKLGSLESEKGKLVIMSEVNRYEKCIKTQIPWIKDLIRRRVLEAQFEDMREGTWQNNLTDYLKNEINKFLSDHGMEKRVVDVLMDGLIYTD